MREVLQYFAIRIGRGISAKRQSDSIMELAHGLRSPTVVATIVLIALAIGVSVTSTGGTAVLGPSDPGHGPREVQPMAPSFGAPTMSASHGLRMVPSPAPPGISPLGGSPDPSGGVPMAYDQADGYVVALDSNATTWKYSGGQWSQINVSTSPPAVSWATMTYDAHDGYVVFFGGVAPTQRVAFVNYTWAYSNGTWTNLTPSLGVSPPGLAEAQMTYDATDGYVVLHGGFNDQFGIDGSYMVTWTFVNATWTNVTDTSQPMPTVDGTMAYDPTDGYVVYFGGDMDHSLGTGVYTNATWTFVNGTWTNVTGLIHGAPSPRDRSGLVYDPVDGYILLFGGLQLNQAAPNQYLNDTWSYSNLTWSLISNASGPGPRQHTQMTYDAADGFVLMFGGFGLTPAVTTNGTVTAQDLNLADSWSYSGGIWSPQAPVVLSARPQVDTGTELQLEVTATPWMGTPRFTYTALPPGCESQDSATLRCLPTAPGVYRPGVEVIASSGAVSWTATQIQVNLVPSLVSFAASNPVVLIGQSVRFTALAQDGTGTLAYVYTGLPAGCESSNAPQLVCTPSQTGTFSVAVQVTDDVGGSGSSQATIQVVPTGAYPPRALPPTHGPRSGGLTPGLPGSALSAPTSPFIAGLAIGLSSLVIVTTWTVRRVRLAREGESLVSRLENAPTVPGPDSPREPGPG